MLISAQLIISCGGGGGGGGDFEGEAQVAGRAVAPSTGLSGSPEVPLANGTVTVLGVLPSRLAQTSSSDGGMTDADGNYLVTLPAGGGAIIVNGTIDGNPIRISGLLKQQSGNESKGFHQFTDIACQAYISALNSGELAPEHLTPERIDILENAAIEYLATNQVNFFDPASVTVAANEIKNRTGNGAFPSTPATPTPTPEDNASCQQGLAMCADGFPICEELFCNGTVDCADGSDEAHSVCNPQ